VLVDERDVLASDPIPLRRSIGYVFQRFGLFPHRTLAENVAVGPRLAGWGAHEVTARTRELLELLGLPPDTYAARYPRELSGGQQQRVGLARALAARPHIMLMDEPFGALDVVTRSELQVSYRRLHDELGLTTLMVTHDVVEALLLADRVFVLHEGSIAFDGAPRELLDAPPPGAVARLLEVARRQTGALEALAR
jgi:osmoprotectant transport system ATP-binding protein